MGTAKGTLGVRVYVDEILIPRLPPKDKMKAQMFIQGTKISIPLEFVRMQPYVSPKIELSNQRQRRSTSACFRSSSGARPRRVSSSIRESWSTSTLARTEGEAMRSAFTKRLLVASASAATCVAFAACAVGPNFVRPATPQGKSLTAQPLLESTALADGKAQRFAAGQKVAADWWRLLSCPGGGPAPARYRGALRGSWRGMVDCATRGG
jgi:hypothetical protein